MNKSKLCWILVLIFFGLLFFTKGDIQTLFLSFQLISSSFYYYFISNEE